MNEFLGTISMVLAVIGVMLNNRKMIGCFKIWLGIKKMDKTNFKEG